MKYHLITSLLLVAAVISYFVGFGEGIVPLMAAYLILEFAIGIRFTHRRRQRRIQAQGVAPQS